MNVAVMTMTRDRLDYTRHCFGRLQELAGCSYDHFVLDQGSKDDTVRWLNGAGVTQIVALEENIGCCRGWNLLLDRLRLPERYDVIVCFDNDCELVQPDTLKTIAGLAHEHDVLLSPKVLGLRYPVPTAGEFQLGDHTVDETQILGNIFMAIPARLLQEFRWDESRQTWDGGELIVPWFRSTGGRAGYVQGFTCNHYPTTDQQHQDFPWYFERRVAEGAPD